jgi:hypothetical protein
MDIVQYCNPGCISALLNHNFPTRLFGFPYGRWFIRPFLMVNQDSEDRKIADPEISNQSD